MQKCNIEFTASDQTILRGWLYLPENLPAPCIIITHGFAALKEHCLDRFAHAFAAAGFCALVYDNRNFGESDGEPRFEIDPIAQVQDIQAAISYAQTLPQVEIKKIGLWGTSLSAGNVIVVAAIDARARCVVAQVPFVSGQNDIFKQNKPELWGYLQRRYLEDERDRARGLAPKTVAVVDDEAEKSVVMRGKPAFDFFRSVPGWKNIVTLRSVNNVAHYEPITYIEQVKPAPLLFIVAEQDKICPTELALQAYEKAHSPKKLMMISGDHFAPYGDKFDICAQTASDWFSEAFKEVEKK